MDAAFDANSAARQTLLRFIAHWRQFHLFDWIVPLMAPLQNLEKPH
jgi:hypothetical protein